jgi:plastocyanin/FtsP/CotA-like multicopper oxidase with cupredoxin domain
MALVELWIQIENHAWDVCPANFDRMMGTAVNPSPGPPVTLTSPVTGVSTSRTMYKPLTGDALILRRYTANWGAPDDRKVNPWDLNEPDPTDGGTMGTIPGATIECSVGDEVIVHFRNMDVRTDPNTGDLLAAASRAHSLHPHGITFPPQYDGAFPLSPPDTTQPVPAAEAAAWSSVGVSGFRKGDRVPGPTALGQPGGTFDYHWSTFGWPTTGGVWLYHDHSICADQNVNQGAIGALVIHNPADPEDVIVGPPDLPDGLPNGTLFRRFCIPIPRPFPLLPGALTNLVGMTEAGAAEPADEEAEPERLIRMGEAHLRLDRELENVIELCLNFLIDPPANAQYIQLFHELDGVGMCINGRKYMGNTPTVIGGANTKMRFGVIGMGSDFHVFHLHGNRWIIPGPDGTDLGTIQNSPEVRAVSQFEDSRTFGPANSFSFTIPQGTFFGASPAGAIGEWHMHCHVLAHMFDGMMGSLLIIKGGELFFGLPSGMACPPPPGPAQGIDIINFTFSPATKNIAVGDTVVWTNKDGVNHSVTSNPGPSNCTPPSMEVFDSGGTTNPILPGKTFGHTFNMAGTFAYHCEFHGCGMSGTITVS